MAKIAKLDADGVYWGLEDRGDVIGGNVVFFAETIPLDQRVEGAVYIDGDNDLPPGRYRWNAAAGSLEPLDKAGVRSTPSQPLPDRALYDLIRAMGAQGAIAIPPYTQQWADWYATTFDQRYRRD